MTVHFHQRHFHQRHNEAERTAWRQSVATLVATLNNPTLIAAALFCLIALLVTAGGLRYERYVASTHAAAGATPLCFEHTCFGF
jgi:hypothetical protein